MNKTDCFAMKNNRCRALKTKHCEDCVFYKTTEQINQSVEKAYDRLRGLDSTTQTYVAEKYYHGRICW